MRRNEAEYLVSFLSMLITHAWVRPYRLHGKIATTAPRITPPLTKRFFFVLLVSHVKDGGLLT